MGDAVSKYLIKKHARAAGLPEGIAMGIGEVESGYNPKARSKAGAVGAMQVMRATGLRHVTPEEFDTEEGQIKAGAYEGARLYKKNNGDVDKVVQGYLGGTYDPYTGMTSSRYSGRVKQIASQYDVPEVESATPDGNDAVSRYLAKKQVPATTEAAPTTSQPETAESLVREMTHNDLSSTPEPVVTPNSPLNNIARRVANAKGVPISDDEPIKLSTDYGDEQVAQPVNKMTVQGAAQARNSAKQLNQAAGGKVISSIPVAGNESPDQLKQLIQSDVLKQQGVTEDELAAYLASEGTGSLFAAGYQPDVKHVRNGKLEYNFPASTYANLKGFVEQERLNEMGEGGRKALGTAVADKRQLTDAERTAYGVQPLLLETAAGASSKSISEGISGAGRLLKNAPMGVSPISDALRLAGVNAGQGIEDLGKQGQQISQYAINESKPEGVAGAVAEGVGAIAPEMAASLMLPESRLAHGLFWSGVGGVKSLGRGETPTQALKAAAINGAMLYANKPLSPLMRGVEDTLVQQGVKQGSRAALSGLFGYTQARVEGASHEDAIASAIQFAGMELTGGKAQREEPTTIGKIEPREGITNEQGVEPALDVTQHQNNALFKTPEEAITYIEKQPTATNTGFFNTRHNDTAYNEVQNRYFEDRASLGEMNQANMDFANRYFRRGQVDNSIVRDTVIPPSNVEAVPDSQGVGARNQVESVAEAKGKGEEVASPEPYTGTERRKAEGTSPTGEERRYAYRVRDVGEKGIAPTEQSHAQATMSLEDAQKLAESRSDGEQEIVKIDLSKVDPAAQENIQRGGKDWVRFNKDVDESAINHVERVPSLAEKLQPAITAAEDTQHHSTQQNRAETGEFTPGFKEDVNGAIEKPSVVTPVTGETARGGAGGDGIEPTGLKKAEVAKDREARGVDPIDAEARRRQVPLWDEAKADIESGKSDPLTLAKEIGKTKRPITDKEVATLLHGKRTESTRHTEAIDAVSKAIDAGDKEGEVAARVRAMAIEENLNTYEQATRASMRENARGMAMMRRMVEEDYTLAKVLQRAKANRGEELPEKVRKEFEDLHRRLKEKDAAIETQAQKLSEMESRQASERTVDNLKKDEVRQARQSKRAVTKEKLKDEWGDLVRQLRNEDKPKTEAPRNGQKIKESDTLTAAVVKLGGIKLEGERGREIQSRLDKQGRVGVVKMEGRPIEDIIHDLEASGYPEFPKENGAVGKAALDELSDRIERELKKERIHQTSYQEKLDADLLEEKFDDWGTPKLEFGKPSERGAVTIDVEMVQILAKMARNLVRQGVNKAADIVDTIHREVGDYLGASVRDIRDAISGYGKTAEMSRKELDVQLRNAKRLMRLESGLEDAQKGERPLRSGLQRNAESPEVRAAKRLLADEMKRQGLKIESKPKDAASQQRTILDARKANLRNQIKELDERIGGTFKPKEKLKVDYDDETIALMAERDVLKRQLEDPVGKNKTELQERITEVERKLREGDLKRPEPEYPKEIYDDEQTRGLRGQLKAANQRLAEARGEPKLQEQIVDLKRRIREGDFSKAGQPPAKPVGARTAALRAEKNRLQSEYRLLESNSPEQVIRNLNKQITENQRRIDTNDVKAKAQPTKPTSPEIEALRSKNADLLKTIADMREAQKTDAEKGEATQKTRKTQLEKQIRDLEERLSSGRYTVDKKPASVYDATNRRLEADRNRLQKEIETKLQEQERANRGRLQKTADFINRAHREIALSSTAVFGKLGSAATGRIIMEPIERGVSSVIAKAMPNVADAGSQTRFSGAVEAGALGRTFSKETLREMRNAAPKITGGKGGTDLAALHDTHNLMPEEVAIFGHYHEMLKIPAKINSFYRATAEWTKWHSQQEVKANIEKGMSKADAVAAAEAHIQSPEMQALIGAKAYQYAQHNILMQSNKLSSMFNHVMNVARNAGDDVTAAGKVGKGAGRTVEAIGRFLFPVTKVAPNYIGEVLSYTPAGYLKAGLKGAELVKAKLQGAEAFKKVLTSLKPEDANYIMKNLSKATVGTALMAVGFLGRDNIGGYYNSEDAKKKDKPDFGGMTVYGWKVPRMFLHTPILEMLQIGATIGHIYDKSKASGDSATRATAIAGTVGTGEAAKGLLDEIPFLDSPVRLFREAENIGATRTAVKQLTTSMIPPDVKKTATTGLPFGGKFGDLDESGEVVKRKPQNPWEDFKSSIPVWRQSLDTGGRKSTGASKQ